jgi:ferredoxin
LEQAVQVLFLGDLTYEQSSIGIYLIVNMFEIESISALESLMKVVIDADLCQGHTLCALSAPQVFGLREEDGHAYSLMEHVPLEFQIAASRAAEACPERAITIVAEEGEDVGTQGHGES